MNKARTWENTYQGIAKRNPPKPRVIRLNLKPGDKVMIYRRILEPGEQARTEGRRYTYIKRYPFHHLLKDDQGFYESFGDTELAQRMRRDVAD